jgi:CheY-like chemotaxis protein
MTGQGSGQGAPGRILVVDDARMNRLMLERALRTQGHEVETVGDGVEALAALRTRSYDVVLLDLEMPRKDGFETLAEIKADPDLRELPVIIISTLEDTASVVRCIEMGALDHLPKPFEPALLEARIGAALAAKRLRDLELEYLQQVRRLTRAAEGLEADAFEPSELDAVAGREDALGTLARTFVRMAAEVRSREEALRRQVRELTIEIDEAQQARKVAEVTDSDYFRSLRGRAAELRRTVRGGAEREEPADADPGHPDRSG